MAFVASGAAQVRLPPGALNPRQRPDRAGFEDVLRRNRRRLVAFGPMYKAFGRAPRDGSDKPGVADYDPNGKPPGCRAA
ncbi:MAG: hypothetical protein ACLQVK_06705 [Acidimicrobiales bacterium]